MDESSKTELINEEQKILNGHIDHIIKCIESSEQAEEAIIAAINHAKDSGNKDEYARIIVSLRELNMIAEDLDKARKGRDRLYDTRAEVTITGVGDPADEELLIGLHECTIGGEYGKSYIHKWDEQICRPFWGGQCPETTELDIETRKYGIEHIVMQLHLKRTVELRFSKVVNAEQQFPSEYEAEKIIYDILLKELELRRDETEWRNIISSIQQKQKDIVLAPLKSNLIVQGCAGSGKTMIMLHRLPIILLDYQDSIKREGVYIISPSESYIQMAEQLCEDLEIQDIRKGTINQYYEMCIKRYLRQEINYGEVDMSIEVTPQQEKYYYSEECLADMLDKFDELIRKDSDVIQAAEAFLGISNLDVNKGDIEKRFINKQNSLIAILKANEDSIDAKFSCMMEVKSSIDSFIRELNNLKTRSIREIEKQITEERQLYDKNLQEMAKLDPQKNQVAIKNRQEIMSNSLKKMEELQNKKQEIDSNNSFYDEVRAFTDDVAKKLSPFDGLNKKTGDNSIKAIQKGFERIETLITIYKLVVSKIEQNEISQDPDIRSAISKLKQAAPYVEQLINNKWAIMSDTELKKIEELQKENRIYLPNAVFRAMLSDGGFFESRKNTVPRFAPYLYLQLLYTYEGAPGALGESLISIDETQGISPCELELIKNVNHGKPFFDMFGDVRQHIENTKGIDDWGEFSHIIESDYYELNENYRNSKEIAEFCAKRFNIPMTALNYPGQGVHIWTDDSLDADLADALVGEKRAGLSALIVKNWDEALYIKDMYPELMIKVNDMILEHNSIHRSRWNLLSVDDVKGLEFTNVIVFSGRMTENEKYIAYTRALERLCIYEGIVGDEPDTAGETGYTKEKSITVINKPVTEDSRELQPEHTHQKKNEKADTKDNSVYQFFKDRGLNVVDNRAKGGRLWVIGSQAQIGKHINEATELFGIMGQYGVSKEIDNKEGWSTKTKK